MPDAASPVLDHPTGERTRNAPDAELCPVDVDVESNRSDDEDSDSELVGARTWGVRRDPAGRRRVRPFVRRHWKRAVFVR